jgi:K(+)-stimulated pyrophosphate-energized sodium pump
MHQTQYSFVAGQLTVASPMVLIGFLIGGAVPFLFSAMLLRAVGRAAQLIVRECRKQFEDAEILAGTKKPDYGRVVDICTTTAQRELLGPGILAIFTPIFVGFLLGPFAMGGFLAGMILVGLLLALFMANAGGAWDNAKKMIEDGLYGGKGSEAHKASVTGDTVGDPLKDTAGPAISPLVKVVTMVSLLSLSFVLANNAVGVNPKTASNSPAEWVLKGPTDWPTGLIVVVLSLSLILWAVWQSVRGSGEADEEESREDFKRVEAGKAVSKNGEF